MARGSADDTDVMIRTAVCEAEQIISDRLPGLVR